MKTRERAGRLVSHSRHQGANFIRSVCVCSRRNLYAAWREQIKLHTVLAREKEVKEGSGCCCTLMISTTQQTHNLLSAVVFVDKSDLTSTIFFVSANRRPFAGAIVKNLCTLSFEGKWVKREAGNFINSQCDEVNCSGECAGRSNVTWLVDQCVYC